MRRFSFLARLFGRGRKAARLVMVAALLNAALSACAQVRPLINEPVPTPSLRPGAASPAATPTGGRQTPEPAPSPTEEAPCRRALTGDFDGDGLLDAALLTGFGENRDEQYPHATLAVYLGNGDDLTYDFAGEYWEARSLDAGDFDGDGIDELALFLVSWTSNYGGGNAFVLHVQDGALKELPYKVSESGALEYDGRGCISALSGGIVGGFGDVIGVTALPDSRGDRLRLQLPLDVKERMTAWYYDLAFNGKSWETAGMALGVAYGDELLPVTLLVPEIPAAHRPRFSAARLSYAGRIYGDMLPDKRYYDWETGKFTPTAYETAQTALRVLYDMTGVSVGRCYVSGTWRTLDVSLKGSYKTVFLSFGYGQTPDGTLLYIMNLCYKGNRYPNSPIDPAVMVKPEGYEGMSKGELARWYYENSSYGDRRPIVSAEESGAAQGYVNLVLSSGEFYEIGFDEECGLPSSFYGPYPEGFTH
ncbi:MAG: VCBS repeat-containing protein [Clostridiaceae bacterium]